MLDHVDSSLTTARISIAITWLQDGPHSFSSHSILDKVRGMRGVEEVHFSPEGDSILKIEYTKKRTDTNKLVDQIHELGIMTKLVDY